MMGRKHREQASLFYEFRLDDMIPRGHLLRRINVFVTSVLPDGCIVCLNPSGLDQSNSHQSRSMAD